MRAIRKIPIPLAAIIPSRQAMKGDPPMHRGRCFDYITKPWISISILGIRVWLARGAESPRNATMSIAR